MLLCLQSRRAHSAADKSLWTSDGTAGSASPALPPASAARDYTGDTVQLHSHLIRCGWQTPPAPKLAFDAMYPAAVPFAGRASAPQASLRTRMTAPGLAVSSPVRAPADPATRSPPPH